MRIASSLSSKDYLCVQRQRGAQSRRTSPEANRLLLLLRLPETRQRCPTGPLRLPPSRILHRPQETQTCTQTKVSAATGLGSRPIVDDISEGVSEPLDEVSASPSCTTTPSAISTRMFLSRAVRTLAHSLRRFLTNPDDSHCRLTLLQSLIIELGLATSSLPATMRAAKAYLKTRAFVNIRDYLALRGQGPDALQSAMYPTRSALIKDIRRKRNQASLKWVKQNGCRCCSCRASIEVEEETERSFVVVTYPVCCTPLFSCTS
ncbi:hypothetical protein CPB85DRAFT_329806 [Mucidula mucida]|nr:hypothetical protein CPB85DRAFT_329806 [Mucidula mucida]